MLSIVGWLSKADTKTLTSTLQALRAMLHKDPLVLLIEKHSKKLERPERGIFFVVKATNTGNNLKRL